MIPLTIVNGEAWWADYLPGVDLHPVRIQESRWVLQSNKLFVWDRTGCREVQSVLWRVGAVSSGPEPDGKALLETIAAARVPCVNNILTLLRCHERLAMRNEVLAANAPLLPCDIAIGPRAIENIKPIFPVVLKVGSHHGGIGKALARNEEEWRDLVDLAAAANTYATLEPFIEYKRDIRILTVGESMWAICRRSSDWKASRVTDSIEAIRPPADMLLHARRLQEHLQADMLATDFLEDDSGNSYVIEVDATPSFSGFPEAARDAAAQLIQQRLLVATKNMQ
ncbi:MAG: RimK family alpha-L-glutamate ligase [Candidatus Methylacidiphilales bacterium]|nr:hypothetical protein [Candidatus Methylacidiphilales bacterium]